MISPSDDDIRRRAHEIWLAEGQPEGQAQAHWERAASELGSPESEPERPAADRMSMEELGQQPTAALK
jgi:hypothetical protein